MSTPAPGPGGPQPTPRLDPGLARAVLTLLAGSAAAQALPLLLGPWLARLYGPEAWGAYALFAALAANVAVVACARFEHALPLEAGDEGARELLALCGWVLAGVTAGCVLAAGVLAASGALGHAVWLPAAVLAAGLAQALTLWANRARRFGAIAGARLVQYGGAAVLQGLLGLAWAGSAAGLVAGPVFAALLAAPLLARDAPAGGWRALTWVPWARLRAAARRHRDFPLLNTPHALAGALQDTLTVVLLVAWSGEAAAGFWALALRYLKAPATLVGGAVSQALYPRLAVAEPAEAGRLVRRTMVLLLAVALPLVCVLLLWGPALFAWAFGERWREAGELARALAPYIGAHFVASPLGVVTMAWRAQAWALRMALAGQGVFLAALAAGLATGGLVGGAWAVSGAMVVYFALYLWALARWRDIPSPGAADDRAVDVPVQPGPAGGA
jgi:O-antigen/teichoic acid export membrane protein